MGVKPGWTRVSFPYYMSNGEFEFLLSALEFIGVYGQRFLSLYQFNWKSGTWTFDRVEFERILLRNVGDGCCSCGSSIINAIEEQRRYKDSVDANVLQKYASYLKTAKYIASMLPAFPPEQIIPSDIDQRHLIFRV